MYCLIARSSAICHVLRLISVRSACRDQNGSPLPSNSRQIFADNCGKPALYLVLIFFTWLARMDDHSGDDLIGFAYVDAKR